MLYIVYYYTYMPALLALWRSLWLFLLHRRLRLLFHLNGLSQDAHSSCEPMQICRLAHLTYLTCTTTITGIVNDVWARPACLTKHTPPLFLKEVLCHRPANSFFWLVLTFCVSTLAAVLPYCSIQYSKTQNCSSMEHSLPVILAVLAATCHLRHAADH